MSKRQRGFIDIPTGFFETLFALSLIGVLALLAAVGWGVWWLVTHIQFVGT